MRLDFNILWVEDQQQNVKAQASKIGTLLKKEGFRANVEFAASVDEAILKIGSDIFGDHIDIVLMDFDLGEGPDGVLGIEKVREEFPYKDIVFYSAKGVQPLRDAMKENNIQGIYFSDREGLPYMVEGVFQTLTKKVLDIEHSRGIILGAVSEIDGMVMDAICHAYNTGEERKRDSALEYIKKQANENHKSINKELEKVVKVRDLSELEKYHLVFTSEHRLRLLRRMLADYDKYKSQLKDLIEYQTDVIPVRNNFAHVKVKKVGFSRTIFDRNGVEITSDRMRDFRIRLIKYYDVFEDVLSSISNEERGKGAKPTGSGR
jgi:hypothetical protein